MAAAVIDEPTVAPEETPRVERVEDLPDPVRREIVAVRESGLTLAELKSKFGHVAPDVIREVLPPANARERKQREAKTKPKGEVKQPQVKKVKTAEPKAASEPRYATDKDLVDSLAERTVAARQLIGRGKLAELLGVTGSACWRFEHGRIHPAEVEPLYEAIAKVEDRVKAGEFTRPERSPKAKAPSRAELAHRVEVAVEFISKVRGDRSVSKSDLADGVLAVLEPKVDAPQA